MTCDAAFENGSAAHRLTPGQSLRGRTYNDVFPDPVASSIGQPLWVAPICSLLWTGHRHTEVSTVIPAILFEVEVLLVGDLAFSLYCDGWVATAADGEKQRSSRPR